MVGVVSKAEDVIKTQFISFSLLQPLQIDVNAQAEESR